MGDGARERVSELVVSAAGRIVELQREDGSFPPGHNGPYRDPETPVRNTAHWCVTLLAAWRQTQDPAFRSAAERACAYLSSPAARPGDGPFHCRSNPKKDKTNGLIGQAWAIEALVDAGASLARQDLLETASAVFRLHPYDGRVGGWRRVGLDGKATDFDRTFNHQLWFCAAGALLVNSGVWDAEPAVRHFVSRIPGQMRLYRSGLIRHVSPRFLARQPLDVLVLKRMLRYTWYRKHLVTKSIGYHAFNTYALAMLHRALPDSGLATQPRVSEALGYLTSAEYFDSISRSPYGFPYNPPGFEAAVTIDTFFPDRQDLVTIWLERQLAATYNAETGHVDRQAADPITSAARLYEACRLRPNFGTALPFLPNGETMRPPAGLGDS